MENFGLIVNNFFLQGGINYCQRIQPQLASLTISTNSSNCLNSEAQKKLKNTSVNMCQSQKRIESVSLPKIVELKRFFIEFLCLITEEKCFT